MVFAASDAPWLDCWTSVQYSNSPILDYDVFMPRLSLNHVTHPLRSLGEIMRQGLTITHTFQGRTETPFEDIFYVSPGACDRLVDYDEVLVEGPQGLFSEQSQYPGAH